jgi:arylsulfatase A-like enzyme
MDRRSFMKKSVGAAALNAGFAVGVTRAEQAERPAVSNGAISRPNIILYLSDQFRWDFLGANGLNPSTRTPNLDAMAGRCKNFTQAITNQPVCGPARSVLMTSRYATETGVWHNDLPLDEKLPTVAGELRKAGYTANLIGKWHLAPSKAEEGGGPGFVAPKYRGGFLDLWEGANLLEHATHPYEGTIYNGAGEAISYKDQYRVDFLTDRAEKFLRQKHEKPFFLFISQLEPHQQNDMFRVVGPKGSAEKFANSYVPPDLRALPGNWQAQLPDYYGAIESIDASVGRVRKVLEEEKLADNTIFIFMSDHGCHFMTRNKEYKRSTHNSSIRTPLLIDGPGFTGAQKIDELVSIIDYAPTILDMAGVATAAGMRGKSLVPLVHDQKAREAWPNKKLIQISETMTGRAIRTPEWTYCVADVNEKTKQASSGNYREYQMYDQRSDPAELVNLAGRQEYVAQATKLREELKQLIIESGDPAPVLEANKLYP